MSDKKYSDIINLPHHVSERHPQMAIADRAVQFAPFAALSGYDDAIRASSEVLPEEAVRTEAWELTEMNFGRGEIN